MASVATQTDGFKVTVSAGTPVVLGLVGTKFQSITFFGVYAAKTLNTDTVWVGLANGTLYVPIAPGGFYTWVSQRGLPYTADMFRIDSVVSGEGVGWVAENPSGYDGP